MKKLSVMILTALFLCLSVAAALAGEENGFYYDVENGEAIVISYGFDNDNPETKLVIPDKLGGYPVTAIGYNAFDGCYWLKEVTLPNSLEKISWYAFAGCSDLKEVKIPFGVSVIGKGAFSNCHNLQTISLPDSLVQIDGYAFENCGLLREITIPAGVERVTNFTFGGCYELSKINVKGSNTQIYRWAFGKEGYDIPFYMTLDTDSVTFTCWPGQIKNSRSYSPELFAVQSRIKNIRFYEEEMLPPPIAAPVPPTVEDIPEDVVETGYPVVIVPLLNNSKGQYQDGSSYDPKKDGLVINRKPQEAEDKDDTDNTCTRKYEMVPCDAYGNELKFWEGEAYILFFYNDFIVNGEPLTREAVALYDFKVAHEYQKGKFEYFDTDDIVFEKHGFRVKIKSLSPFTITVSPNVGNVSDVPKTGDDSMNLMVLFAAFVLSASAAVMIFRKRMN